MSPIFWVALVLTLASIVSLTALAISFIDRDNV